MTAENYILRKFLDKAMDEKTARETQVQSYNAANNTVHAMKEDACHFPWVKGGGYRDDTEKKRTTRYLKRWKIPKLIHIQTAFIKGFLRWNTQISNQTIDSCTDNYNWEISLPLYTTERRWLHHSMKLPWWMIQVNASCRWVFELQMNTYDKTSKIFSNN